MTETEAEYSDVLIIGAGISGIGAAYRIHENNPGLSYTVLERRERIGGTWDLFRYPGIRSDSDIFTLSFPFEPWTRAEFIADGRDIWQYLDDTARKHRIDEHIRFDTYVRSADWDSETDTWTVRTEHDGADKTYRCRFLFFGTGYYDYDSPHHPEFPGMEDFAGEVVHPQYWPESTRLHGKAGRGHRQRRDRDQSDPDADRESCACHDAAAVAVLSCSRCHESSRWPALIRKVLPRRIAHWVVRWRNALFFMVDLPARPQGADPHEVGDPQPRHPQSARRLSTSTRISNRSTTRGTSGCA